MKKPRLSFWQISNMSFGFLGIQFGWGLQLANMSAIYSYLGAKESDIPLLWLAGPVTGLIVQPIIGAMSDRTWNWLGRRRPYFLVGAILSSLALFVMPDSTSVRMAAGFLWVLDASINISMEPFRAFVADKLNPEQRTVGFVMQSFFIGIGATLANALPYIFRYSGVTGRTASGIPLTVQYSFKIGAVAFLIAVLWTVFTTKEYPPEDMAEFERKRREHKGIGAVVTALLKEIFSAIGEMPATMRQLAVVQLFTWLGLFCMWLFFGLMTSYHVFGATSPKDARFPLGGEWGGICFAVYSIVTFVVAFALAKLAAATSRKTVHAAALVCGGIGLLSVYLIHDKWTLLLTMVGVGIAWASILSMPYAILSGALPDARIGIYMGVFNFFIVIPEIIQALTFGPIIRALFGPDNHNAPLYMVMAGGGFMLIAALLVLRVQDLGDRQVPEDAVINADEHLPIIPAETAQPVPSTGLIDRRE
ncbi:MAG: maltose/moltooligosaccharide transporter [Blastocatellia bacterium]|jgi:maltose/moltooligosaccharide transporter|nr:maltose/moltooligosaccharide transporter [Blastocatellia bacterium]